MLNPPNEASNEVSMATPKKKVIVPRKKLPWHPIGVYRMAHLPIRPILTPYDWIPIKDKK